MPSGRGRWRWQANRAVYDEFARSPAVRELLKERADVGANVARTIAPEYHGLTWGYEKRMGEYKASIYSAATLQPNGWRAEFGADAPWTLQVEFGTGRRGKRKRSKVTKAKPRSKLAALAASASSSSGGGLTRPQYGWSPKFRILGRSLDALRARSN